MTAAVTERPAPLRLLRPPVSAPPYDDERQLAAPVVDGSLALAFPHDGRSALPLRLVPPAIDRGAGATARGDLPEPDSWARRLAQAVVEVLVGARPASQLARFATLDVLHQLERSTGRLIRQPAGQPVIRPVVASVRISEPAAAVAEACAVVDTGPRRRALALRFEGIDGRWQCTALQVG